MFIVSLSGTINAQEALGSNSPQSLETQSSKAGKNEQEGTKGHSNSKIIELDEYIIVGTRTEINISMYPGSASKLNESDLMLSNNVIESLSQVPGIETGGSQSRNIGQQYTIRGFGYQSEERVIIKLDGVRRSTSLYSNQISSFRVDSDLLKSIDIVKGASSVSHGGGAIGGVIGMKTKDAFDYLKIDQKFGTTVKARYESNNHRDGYLALYGTLADEKFDYLVYYKKGKTGDLTLSSEAIELDDDVFSDKVENDEDLSTFFVKIGFSPTVGQRLTLSHYDFGEDTTVTWQTLYHSNYSSVTGPVIGSLSQKDTVLNYTINPSSTELLNLTVIAFNSASFYDRSLDYISDDVHTHLDYKNEDERYGVNAKNLFEFHTGNIDHRLLVGFDYEVRNEDASYVRDGVVSDFGSMPNEYRNMGFYIQEEAHLLDNSLVLHIGGRQDWFERDVHHGEQKYDNSRFSPRIGASYEVVDGFNLLANISESYRAPTPHETSSEGPLNPHYWYLPNPDLSPEIAEEYELGFSYVSDGVFSSNDSLWIKSMYFNGEIDNMISFEERFDLGQSPDDTTYAQYQNVEKAKRSGLELEVKYKNGPWQTGFSYETLDQYDTATNEKVPQGFADKIRFSGSYTFDRPNITLGVVISHWMEPDQNPESIVSRGVTYYYVNESYTISNLRAAWRPVSTGIEFFDNDVEVEVGVNNLTDDNYINARGVMSTSRVGKGRNLYMTFMKRF